MSNLQITQGDLLILAVSLSFSFLLYLFPERQIASYGSSDGKYFYYEYSRIGFKRYTRRLVNGGPECSVTKMRFIEEKPSLIQRVVP